MITINTDKLVKLKWEVGDVPTGTNNSFFKRAWPTAYYSNGRPAASLYCEDAYVPKNVKTGNHAPLEIRIARYTDSKFVWLKLTKKAETLQEAKQAVEYFINKHLDWIPDLTKD